MHAADCAICAQCNRTEVMHAHMHLSCVAGVCLLDEAKYGTYGKRPGIAIRRHIVTY